MLPPLLPNDPRFGFVVIRFAHVTLLGHPPCTTLSESQKGVVLPTSLTMRLGEAVQTIVFWTVIVLLPLA